MALSLIYLSFWATHTNVDVPDILLLLDKDDFWIVKAKIVGKFWNAGIVYIKSTVFYTLPFTGNAERGGEGRGARKTLLMKSLQRNNIPWSDENRHLIKEIKAHMTINSASKYLI